MTDHSLRAICFVDKAAHRAEALPGSVWFSDPCKDAVAALWFFCPCGCGLHRITVGERHKPAMGVPSWRWCGSFENPTLTPSVNQRACGWHGWLSGGYWEPC